MSAASSEDTLTSSLKNVSTPSTTDVTCSCRRSVSMMVTTLDSVLLMVRSTLLSSVRSCVSFFKYFILFYYLEKTTRVRLDFVTIQNRILKLNF